MKQLSEVRLIQNRSENYFRVTVNGKDAYTPFTYTDENYNEMDVKRTAKACAFDELCREQGKGNKVSAHYDSF